MASPSVTYTFSNSTTADATQVNQNFTDIINALTDGTKDLAISALTCAGNVSFNGNTTIGNASSDTLTLTASLASSVAMSAANSYDIGSATVALRSVYLASSDSAARSTRIIGATVASSYTLTLPTSGGTVGQFVTTDGSGALSWRYPEKTAAKTTTYTGTGDETVITCDATSAGFTVTLPAPASFPYKHYYIKKTDSTFNIVTISGTGISTTLNTQNESIKVVSDSSNWIIVERYIPSVATSYSLSPLLQAVTANPALGSGGASSAYWQRIGNSIRITGHARFGGTGTSFGTGNWLWGLPSGLTTGSSIPTQSNYNPILGHVKSVDDTGTVQDRGYVFVTADESFVRLFAGAGSGAAITSTNPWTWAVNDTISVDFIVPINGWNG